MKKRRRTLLISLTLFVAIVLLIVAQRMCIRTYVFDGVLADECPDGALRQTLYIDAWGLRRGAEGTVHLGATAHFTVADADSALSEPVRRFDAKISLVQGKDKELALEPKKGWNKDGDFGKSAQVVLPEVPDGEYLLRARISSPLGSDTIDLPLPVFAPARIHVITDRPLYQPGNNVQFRAVAFRAKDLAPLDGRPGRWIVSDPSGETVLEEKAAAGDFGVVSGSFPLDAGAPSGDWRVRWVSGGAEDGVSFKVEPFTLPRFRVEASAPKPYYRRGEHPSIRGKVVYSSGAPVKNASLALSWSFSGGWPPPTEWLARVLPKLAAADASGSFDLSLPVVPGDLRGRETIFLHISATDAAGDRVDGGASVLLAEDAIQVAAVTELEDGLVAGFNNRIYLRATTAAGAVLPKTELLVKRAWEPNDKGVKAVTDEDGVAALQLDPGPPVNVVIPPMPYRPPPRPPAITRGEVQDLMTDEAPSLADQLAMDAWNKDLAACARFVESQDGATIGLRVDANGTVVAAAADGRPASRCIRAELAKKKLPAGRQRLYRVQYAVNSDLPQVQHQLEGTPGVLPELEQAIARASLDARACVPRALDAVSLPRVMVWTVKGTKKREVSVGWAPDPRLEMERAPEAVASCVESKLSKLSLPALPAALASSGDEGEEGEEGAPGQENVGIARFSIQPSGADAGERPQATTMIGYELKVSARADAKEELGSTKIFLAPGSVPDVRLRASPVLAEAGGTVEVQILRGPNFHGELPEKMYLNHEKGTIESKVDAKARLVKFTLPADARGWFETTWSTGRALIYVRPKAELTVAVKPSADRYAPGQTAELAISTAAGGQPARAAVGLIGVDASLGQLVALPGPDDMVRVRPKAEMRSPAFEVLDAGALAMGRIRGSNAAAATILRVTTVPAYVELDASISANTHPGFEPLEALTDNFYNALAELHARVRDWEEHAPEKEEMHPATMAKLWSNALAECEKRKEPVTDAFGRRLRLSRLPPDLLALTDPRAVVVNGTRLPEDVENWSAWVAKEQP